ALALFAERAPDIFDKAQIHYDPFQRFLARQPDGPLCGDLFARIHDRACASLVRYLGPHLRRDPGAYLSDPERERNLPPRVGRAAVRLHPDPRRTPYRARERIESPDPAADVTEVRAP